jgi:hypothetical protein
MGGDSGRKERERKAELDLQMQAQANQKATLEAITKAAAPNPFQEAREKQVLDFQDWVSGKKGPIDVRNMPGGAVPLDLYTQARQARDANRIGRGFGTMTSSANPNYVAKLEKENQLERDLAASGSLEQNVNQATAANTGEGYDLSNMYNTQNMQVANMQTGREQSAGDRYIQFLQRPQQPSFLKQLALAAVGGASQMGAAYLGRKPA